MNENVIQRMSDDLENMVTLRLKSTWNYEQGNWSILIHHFDSIMCCAFWALFSWGVAMSKCYQKAFFRTTGMFSYASPKNKRLCNDPPIEFLDILTKVLKSCWLYISPLQINLFPSLHYFSVSMWYHWKTHERTHKCGAPGLMIKDLESLLITLTTCDPVGEVYNTDWMVELD